MAYADQEMSSNKIISIVLVVIIHLLLGYALVTGLAYTAVKKVASQLDMIDIDEEEPSRLSHLPSFHRRLSWRLWLRRGR